MRIPKHAILTVFFVLLLFGFAFSQTAGNYRSAASGNWSNAATWETFDGADWVPASNPPQGTETISVDGRDTVRVDIVVTIIAGSMGSDSTGYLTVADTALIEVTTGFLEFGNGSTYEHARDAGSIPIATWDEGSTLLMTGTLQNAPSNRNQNFYNVTFNTPNLGRNRDMSWDDITIGGDIHVIDTGVNRWYLTSAPSESTSVVTLMGDVIVEAGAFAAQGTSNALTTIIVHHYGNINVTGGNFSLARGSQGSGSGTTTWYLYEGNFSMSNATTQNSNPVAGNAKLVLAANDTQQVSFDNVTYGGGGIHFEVSDTSTMQLMQDFTINGNLVNRGDIVPQGTLTFTDGSVYEHARNGGSVPLAVWQEGSTALFSGITSTAPSNRGQDYYNLILNTPGLNANRDLGLDGNTISGDITVISTGTNRWQMVGSSSGTVTIMGDVIVQAGQFATQGTGSTTDVIVDHYGSINVTGGNFSVSRGQQGSGVGTTTWYLHQGNLSMSDATTQNSNPTLGNAKFVFTGESGIQTLTLSNVTYGDGGLSLQVDSAAILDINSTVVGDSGVFILSENATLMSSHPNGLDGNLQPGLAITLSQQANYTFNGNEAQVPGMLLPDTVGTLTIANLAGVSLNDTLSSDLLIVSSDAVMQIDTLGSVTADSGSINGTIVNKGALDAVIILFFEAGSVYEHARDGGSIPRGVWNEGSTVLFTGITSNAPANRGQDYYNLTLNTPGLVSNRDLGLDGNTIGGDITVISTGTNRWQMVGGSSGTVTIMGDVIVQAGQFAAHGTSSATDVVVDHFGDINVTGGNFSVARGSQGDGSGSTRWYLHTGSFSMADATTQNSNPTNAWFVFDKDTVQTITLSNVNYGGGGLPIEVAAGTTLDFGLNVLAGAGLFILNDGATIATAHTGGLDSTLQNTGKDSISDGASYIFNGTEAQNTGTSMPATVEGLAINNAAGVKLSQETTINGVLRLMAGVFDNTIPFTLGPNGSISFEGGSLLIIDGVQPQPGQLSGIPTVFALFQNYPNPFNPSTTIRYDIPKQCDVTLKVYDIMGRQVAELVNGNHNAGAYQIVWNARGFASGIYYFRIIAGDFVSVKKLVLMK